MMSDKQKEAVKAVLELYKDNKMSKEQVMKVIEAITEFIQVVQDSPLTYPLVTYKADYTQFTSTCRQNTK